MIIAVSFISSMGESVDISGRVQSHYAESVVEGSAGFEDGSSIQGVPNSQKYVSGLFAAKADFKSHFFQSELRYLYDAYGQVLPGAQLGESSQVQARHFAWYLPARKRRFGLIVGRFPIKPLGVSGHDGALATLRIGRSLRLEGFGGFVSDFANSKAQVLREARADPQGGGYVVYEQKPKSGSYIYMSAGVIGTAHPDSQIEDPQILGVHTGAIAPWNGHRLTSHLRLEVAPSARLRQLRLGYSRVLGNWSNFISWAYSNTTSYQLVQDIERSVLEQDEVYGNDIREKTTIYFDSQYKFSRYLAIQMTAEQSSPSENLATYREVTVGPWVRDLIAGFSVRMAAGQAQDAELSGPLYRGSLRYYNKGSHMYADYRYYPGLSETTMPRRETRLGLEVQAFQDYLLRFDHIRNQAPERHRSGYLVTLGRVFGGVKTAPTPKSSPRFEGGA